MIFEIVGKGNLIFHTAGPGKPTRVYIDLHHWIIEFPTFPMKCSILAYEQVQRKKRADLRERCNANIPAFSHFRKSFSEDFRVERRMFSQFHETSCHTNIVKTMQTSRQRGKCTVLCFPGTMTRFN